MAADRRTPTPGNPTIQPGGTFADAVNEEIAAIWNGTTLWLTSVAGTDTITASVEPPLDAYVRGQGYYLEPVGPNVTSDVRLNIGGRGPVDVTTDERDPLAPGSLAAGRVVRIVYDGTRFRLLDGNPTSYGVPITWLGAWSAATAYLPNQGVSHLSKSYVARVSNTNVEPSGDSDATWQLVGSQIASEVPLFLTVTLAAANAFVSAPSYIQTIVYSASVLAGGGVYLPVGSEPSHAGKIQINLGGWYELQLPEAGISVHAFGTPTDEASSCVAGFNAAITYVGDKNGGTILYRPLKYCVDAQIVDQRHNVTHKGVGHQWFDNPNAAGPTRWTQYGGTVVLWTGADNAGNLIWNRSALATGPAIQGGGIDGLIFDGDAKCNFGLSVLSQRGGRFGRITCANFRTRNFNFGVVPDTSWTSTSPRDSQHCVFDQIHSVSWLANAQAAVGCLFNGDAVADASFNQINELFAIHKDQIAVDIQSNDSTQYGNIWVFRISGGAAAGVRIIGGTTTDYPRKDLFRFMQAGAGGLGVLNGTGAPPIDIDLQFYSLGNGTPVPNIGTAALVSYKLDTTNAQHRAIYSASAAINFGSIAAGASADLTISVTGAVANDTVELGLPAAPTAGIAFFAFVSATNTVTVRAMNITAGAIDPASATYRVTVFHY